MSEQCVSVTRYANGKYVLYADGPQGFNGIVLEAMQKCADLQVVLNRMAFRTLLTARGVPSEAAAEFSETFRIIDETYSSDRWRS